MVNIETYLQPGDHIVAMPRTTAGQSVDATVLEVRDGIPGAREIVLVRTGQSLEIDGAVGINERDVIIRVERGDCWIGLSPLMTIEQAQEKCDRSVANQERKAKKAFPLFSDQVEIKEPSAAEWVANVRAGAQKELETEHAKVSEVNLLRDEVRAKVTDEQYQHLLKRRTAYPAHYVYGSGFWRKQLEYIAEHGEPDLLKPPPATVAETLQIPWLEHNGPAIWKTAPGKPIRVKVLFFGRETIMVQVVGEPIKDYDPVVIGKNNPWLRPDELEAEDPALATSDEWINALPFYEQPGYRERHGKPRTWVLPEDMKTAAWKNVRP
jgi:hypothetical protein